MIKQADDTSKLLFHLSTLVQIVKEMKKDTYLFHEGDKADSIYIIHSGKIRIGMTTPEAREVTFRVLEAGDIISEIMLFSDISSYNVHAKVLEDGIYTKVKKEVLESNLLLNPRLNVEVMKRITIDHQKSQSKFRDLILYGKKGALYSTLIRMSNSYGIQLENGILIDLPITNQQLANFSGISREFVNRTLNALKQDGHISMKDGLIILHNLLFLKREIHCQNCPIEVCNIN